MISRSGVFLGINLMWDPSVAAVKDGIVLAYSEEERHVRVKHAPGLYPVKALRYCLETAGVALTDVEAVGINWDIDAYTDGTMKAFYESVRKEFPVDDETVSWQNRNLRIRSRDVYRETHEYQWRRLHGDVPFPPIVSFGHHFVHAYQAYRLSPFDRALCLTLDGSGDSHCTVLWRCEGDRITPHRELKIPRSIGWCYAAFTEYLGFEAYDGEYKVMGLAAYGRPDAGLSAAVARVLWPCPQNGSYDVDPSYIHYGGHRFSKRFTDKLPELLGRPPRRDGEPIDAWHEDLAFAVQKQLEDCAVTLVSRAVEETGIGNVCVGGGVGLNVKMNGVLLSQPGITGFHADPLCADSGAAVGAALAACERIAGSPPQRLRSLALGYQATDDEIEETLRMAGVRYRRETDVCETVAAELASGKIAGWFQGRMEAGPRALGQRSILADPRDVAQRDRVNAIVKFREYWRPFCPSLPAEAMKDYFDRYTEALFMNVSFPCNDRLKAEAPAIVHVDGTSRVQMVQEETHPLYHRLIGAFRKRTGVPVLLNTSFNLKGEPIVCTAKDALRTFFSSGLDLLAIGPFVVRKHGARDEAPGTGTAESSERFTLDAYQDLVKALLDRGYEATSYLRFSPSARHVVLRHDIDMSPGSAVKAARIEAAMGVRATYFALVRTELYNVLSPGVAEDLREIVALGHDLGLHLDASLYATPAELDDGCARECAILESVAARPIEVVSFHRPARHLLGRAEPIAGRRHAYEPAFFDAYCSDSQGAWLHGHPLEHPAIVAGRGLQLLTHPIWWDSDPGEGVVARLERLVAGRAEDTREILAANCQPYRRHRTGRVAGS
ncbi:MAG: carbamoyltransferase C-terminal domain-containing protein [Acidobacteriota bacterium]